MYGLSTDTDVSFLLGATLVQVCVGENETILNFHPDISIMIASAVRITSSEGTGLTLDESRDIGSAMFATLGNQVTYASVAPPGTLALTWTSGRVLEIFDSWKDYESYTITHQDKVIVV